MRLVLIDIEHIERVIRSQGVRAALSIFFAEFVDHDHNAVGLVGKITDMLVQKLRIGHVAPMRILHVQKRHVSNGIALIFRRLISQICLQVGAARLLEVFRAEDIPLRLAIFLRLFRGLGVEHLYFAEILNVKLFVLLCLGGEITDSSSGEYNTDNQNCRSDGR